MRDLINIISEAMSPEIFYRGTDRAYTDFKPATTGFFGPGIYGTSQPGVAAQYGSHIMRFHVEGEIFQAYSSKGTLRLDPTAEDRILDALSPEDRAKVLDWKSWYKDDSAAFWEAMRRRLGKTVASSCFMAAGYTAIEGIGDGHEIVVFDATSIKVLE